MTEAHRSTSNAKKVALFLLLIGGIAWLGGINIRGLLSSRLLVPGTFELKQNLNPIVEREIFRIISYSSMVVLGGYVVVFVGGIVFLRSTHLKLKENGWLAMSALLFYIFAPVEFYTGYVDGKMIWHELSGLGDNPIFQELLIERVAALKGLPFIALLCYYTIIGFIIWQPMKKNVQT